MRTTTIKRMTAILLATALIGGAASCSSAGSGAGPAPSASAADATKTADLTPETGVDVRVAFFPNITHAQALVGQAKGTFAEALGSGNKLEWKQFNAGPAEVEAMFAGEIDIGYIGPGPAINAYVKSNGDFQIIAGATNGGAVLVSRKDLTITDLKNLSGLKIAVPQLGNTQDLSLRNILQENGLSDTTKGGTVEIVAAENADILTLLQVGQIDAALVPEPWGSRLIKEAGGNLVLDYNQIWRDGDYTTAVVLANKEFIAKHPWIVRQFLEAHVQLTNDINENLDEAANVVNDELKTLTGKALSKDILDSAFKRLVVTNDPSADSVKGFADLSYSTGFLPDKPNLDNLFSLQALQSILDKKS